MIGQLNPGAERVDVKPVVVEVPTAAVGGISVGTSLVSDAGNRLESLTTCDFGMMEQDVSRTETRVKVMIKKWWNFLTSCPPFVEGNDRPSV